MIDGARQRAAEAGQVRAAISLRDVVREAQHVLVVAVVPLHRQLDGDVVLLGRHGDGRLVQCLLGAVEIFDEGFDAALVMQIDRLVLGVARIGEVEERA